MKLIQAATLRVFPTVLAILMGGFALYGCTLYLSFKSLMSAEGSGRRPLPLR